MPEHLEVSINGLHEISVKWSEIKEFPWSTDEDILTQCQFNTCQLTQSLLLYIQYISFTNLNHLITEVKLLMLGNDNYPNGEKFSLHLWYDYATGRTWWYGNYHRIPIYIDAIWRKVCVEVMVMEHCSFIILTFICLFHITTGGILFFEIVPIVLVHRSFVTFPYFFILVLIIGLRVIWLFLRSWFFLVIHTYVKSHSLRNIIIGKNMWSIRFLIHSIRISGFSSFWFNLIDVSSYNTVSHCCEKTWWNCS